LSRAFSQWVSKSEKLRLSPQKKSSSVKRSEV
jgi:hypothetical protein